MRNFFILLFLSCALLVNAQGYDLSYTNHPKPVTSVYLAANQKKKPAETYKQSPYWKRYKVLNGLGFGALGVGLCGMFVGYAGAMGTTYSGIDFPGLEIFYTGVGLTASCIPLFIFAHINRRKAKRTVEISMNTSHVYMPTYNGRHQAIPTLGLCITF